MHRPSKVTYEEGEHSSEITLRHIPCPLPDCGSSDAFCLYDDGHGHCHACGKGASKGQLEKLGYEPPAESGEGGGGGSAKGARKAVDVDLQEYLDKATIRPLTKRKITQATCKFFNYRTAVNARGEALHIAPYCDPQGRPTGAKVRNTGEDGTAKDFSWVGETLKTELFGQHLWSSGGRMVVVTEGEIDCMTVSQAWSNKFPVVSTPNGAAAAKKDLARHVEWLNTFGKVVLMFDQDPPGQEAAHECAKLFPPGKAYLAKLPLKDPNKVLVEMGDGSILTNAAHNASPYRPDGLVDARDLTEACKGTVEWGLPWPFPFMTDWTYGRRHGEVYTFGGGTGIGKSDVAAEIIASTLSGKVTDGTTYQPEGCAVFGYEAGAVTTKKQIAGKLWSRRFHIPQDDTGVSWTAEELDLALAYMDTDCWERGGKLFINDSFGAADWDAVKDRARFLRHAEDTRHFFVDPISALAMGAEDERKFLDQMVLESSSLAQELGACVYLFSHLARPGDGPSHEEGGRVSLKHFRGSNGIGMFSHFVFGLERNQQAELEEERAETTFRSVKDRFTGNSAGKTHVLHYNTLTGRQDEINLGSLLEA